MNIKIALDLKEISDLLADSEPGLTLPSALSDERLSAAIHDLHQYFDQHLDEDYEGDLFLTGPMFLLRKVLMDKGIQVPGAVVLEFLSQYKLELEIEFLKRLHPHFPIECATLETIFDANREVEILRALSSEAVVENSLSLQELEALPR